MAAKAAGQRWGGLCCNVYVSEGRDPRVLGALRRAAATADEDGAAAAAVCTNVFVDAAYHRTGFTFAAADPRALVESALRLAREGLRLIDFRTHAASHPRLGAVDHVSCHPAWHDGDPAESRGMEGAELVALAIAEALAAGPPAVPVYLYGRASPAGKPLAQVRRELGYFDGERRGAWERGHALPAGVPAADLGAGDFAARSGVACVGAVPWITNYNVGLRGGDLATARRIARAVSERGGGLARVEAMALPHGGEVEVACNLLDSAVSSPADVLARTRELAAAQGIEVGEAYVIGHTPDRIRELFEARACAAS